MHHILYSKQYNNSHKINSSPLISNHIILEQNTMKGNKLRQHYSLVNTVFYVFSPQTPSLVVQSAVRSFPQVTSLFHKIILLDLPQSYKTKEYLTWSLSTTHNITPTVKKMSSAQAQTENWNVFKPVNCKQSQACLPFTSSTKVASHLELRSSEQ